MLQQPCQVSPAPHPPCIQHHGLQGYAIEDELETVHDRSMTATENLKPVKRGKPAEGMPTKHAVKNDGTLSKLSLGKLDKSLSTFADAARDMEAQLMTATTSSDIISCGDPAVHGGEMRSGRGISWA